MAKRQARENRNPRTDWANRAPKNRTRSTEDRVFVPLPEVNSTEPLPPLGLSVPELADPGLFRFLLDNLFDSFSLKQLRSRLPQATGEAWPDDRINTALDVLLDSGRAEIRDNHVRARASGLRAVGKARMLYRDNTAEVAVPGLPEPITLIEAKKLACLPDDLVEVEILRVSGGKVFGDLRRLLRPSRREFVGTIQYGTSSNYFTPQDALIKQDFVVPNDKLRGAQDGQKVRVVLTGFKDGKPKAEIIEIIGETGDHEVEIHAIIAEYRLDTAFDPEAIAEAEAIPDAIPAEEIARRRDFRSIPTMTIDPVDAKDFDDALSFECLPDGNVRIGVHIADVSHYVRPGSALDRDALAKATSVYLVDRTLPMLPEKLSNNLCSLVPHQDRLAYSAVFVLDPEARVVEEWFGRTVIHSDRRFSYEEAQKVLETGEGDFAAELKTMNELAYKLREQRFAKGSIGFETEEVRFRLDEKGKPIELYVKERKDSNKLIEDYMLLANRQVAAFVANKQKNPPIPFPYRVHPVPHPDKLQALSEFVARFGHSLTPEDESPESIAAALNRLSEAVMGRPEQNIVQQMSIRSMPKAIYTTHNDGHYGLGFKYYGHFTSPIRRYPDVLAHRVVDDVLHNRKPHSLAHLEEMCKHSSDREKIAADAERASIKFKMAEYLGEHIGQVFPGMITGITEWGLYVELEGSKIEGMVWLTEMPGDQYALDERTRSIVGRSTGLRLYMGDNVRIRVKKTNPLKRQIDFDFLEKVGENDLPALPPVAPGVIAGAKAKAKAAAPLAEVTPFYAAVFKPEGKKKPTHRGAGGPGSRGKPGPKRRDNAAAPPKRKKK